MKGVRISHNAILHKRKILPVPGLSGDFVNLPSICRRNVAVSAGDIYLYIIHTASDATALLMTDNAQNVMQTEALSLQQVTDASPNSMRAQRLSVSIRNCTIAQNVGSVVRVLNSAQHLNLEFLGGTNASFLSSNNRAELIALMDSDAQVRSYSGHTFTTEKVVTAPPATTMDFKNYWNYAPFDAADRANSNEVFRAANSRNVSNMIIIKFAASTIAQNYDIAIHRQDACRFAHGSVLSSMATPPARASEMQWQNSVQAAQAAASANPVQSLVGIG